MKDKAYKLLALQENISNRAAKDLIDRGVVFAKGEKLKVARDLIETNTKFVIQKVQKIQKLYEDENIVCINKPPFITSEEISKKIGFELLHRLDRETSGVLLLCKNKEFKAKAIEAFKNKEVKKEYIAWVEGRIAEPLRIDLPILTIKKNRAFSKISKNGKEAISQIEPLMIISNRSKIKVLIETGRTHQIRVHLKSISHPIIGDTKYGAKPYKRIMLHSSKIALFGYEFEAKEPKEFDF